MVDVMCAWCPHMGDCNASSGTNVTIVLNILKYRCPLDVIRGPIVIHATRMTNAGIITGLLLPLPSTLQGAAGLIWGWRLRVWCLHRRG